MVVWELDVVGVVVAGVVDEAVDGVEGHSLDPRLVAMGLQLHPVGPEDPNQVWPLTQFYSVDFSQARIDVKKVRFQTRTIKV